MFSDVEPPKSKWLSLRSFPKYTLSHSEICSSLAAITVIHWCLLLRSTSYWDPKLGYHPTHSYEIENSHSFHAFCNMLKPLNHLKQSFLSHQLVECPSIYEMLPNPKYEWKKQPEILVWRKLTKDGDISATLESYGPVESISLFEEALRHNEVICSNFSLGWWMQDVWAYMLWNVQGIHVLKIWFCMYDKIIWWHV